MIVYIVLSKTLRKKVPFIVMVELAPKIFTIFHFDSSK
jgi:hypothetical protein